MSYVQISPYYRRLKEAASARERLKRAIEDVPLQSGESERKALAHMLYILNGFERFGSSVMCKRYGIARQELHAAIRKQIRRVKVELPEEMRAEEKSLEAKQREREAKQADGAKRFEITRRQR